LPEDLLAGRRSARGVDEILATHDAGLRDGFLISFLVRFPRWPPKPVGNSDASIGNLIFRWLQLRSCLRWIGYLDREAQAGSFPRQREGHRCKHHRSVRKRRPRLIANYPRGRDEDCAAWTRSRRECAKQRGGTAAETEQVRVSDRGNGKDQTAGAENWLPPNAPRKQELRAIAASMAASAPERS